MAIKANTWFHCSKPVKFFIIDYRATIFVFAFCLHMRFYSFIVLLIVLGIFYILEIQNIDIVGAFKKIRRKMAGQTIRIK